MLELLRDPNNDDLFNNTPVTRLNSDLPPDNAVLQDGDNLIYEIQTEQYVDRLTFEVDAPVQRPARLYTEIYRMYAKHESNQISSYRRAEDLMVSITFRHLQDHVANAHQNFLREADISNSRVFTLVKARISGFAEYQASLYPSKPVPLHEVYEQVAQAFRPSRPVPYEQATEVFRATNPDAWQPSNETMDVTRYSSMVTNGSFTIIDPETALYPIREATAQLPLPPAVISLTGRLRERFPGDENPDTE